MKAILENYIFLGTLYIICFYKAVNTIGICLHIDKYLINKTGNRNSLAQDDDFMGFRCKQVDYLCVHFEIYYFRFFITNYLSIWRQIPMVDHISCIWTLLDSALQTLYVLKNKLLIKLICMTMNIFTINITTIWWWIVF